MPIVPCSGSATRSHTELGVAFTFADPVYRTGRKFRGGFNFAFFVGG